MIRRPLLLASVLLAALGLAGCKEEPATPQAAATPAAESFHWKMVTAWPKNYPGLGTAAERLAERVSAMSNGRLTIKVYGGGELVPASGDGDFDLLLERVRAGGAEATAYGVPGLTAQSLIRAATRYVPIEGDLLLRG